MYSLGGGAFGAPPYKKALENRYRVEMHVHSPIFQGQFKKNKIRLITLIVWVLGRVKKMPKKGKKMKKIFFFVLNKYQSVLCDTCFYVHFSRAFKKIVFRSVALITKKLF